MESPKLSMTMLMSLLLLFTTAHSHSLNLTTLSKCHEKERSALLEFKAAFFDVSCAYDPDYNVYDYKTWTAEGQNKDCCNWDGVLCDKHSGHVIGLELFYCFSGSINSSSSLFELVHLQSLLLECNNFRYSKIPSAISNLSKLTVLSLSSSNFSGQIPLEILYLTNLFGLDLSENQLSLIGPSLTDLVQTLVNLEWLYLDHVSIPSLIPDPISRLSSLRFLSLWGCGLQGHIPHSITNIISLVLLRLDDNHLIGQIPLFLPNLTSLTHLNLGKNNLVGDITFSFWNLTQLQLFDLSFNKFTGFPKFQRDNDSLMCIDLSGNNIFGEVPEWFINVSTAQLRFLNLSHNNLTGFEGNFSLLKWKKLNTLDLSYNQLKGPLPRLSANTPLRHYLVSNNEFFGEVPTMMCDLFALEVLDLGHNNLSGEIPPCFTNLVGGGNLRLLSLQSNNLKGQVPQLGKDKCQLVLIDMSSNQLEGPIPRDIGNCTGLEFLNLGSNKINDVFPFWLGKLQSFSVLILDSNRFHGTIKWPEGDNHFPNLRIISLSRNKFIGSLPSQYFLGWNAMKVDVDKKDQLQYFNQTIFPDPFVPIHYGVTFRSYYYSLRLNIKGIQMKYEKLQESLFVIDLSCNNFNGTIPESIGILRKLYSLNLSKNMLTGTIPSNLSSLTRLESLDLSHNKLSGEIPLQLADLNSLSSFDVSFNQLTGRIPSSKQFNTFENKSYQGNSGLCGLPLSKKCENTIEALPPPSLEKDHDSGIWIEIDWKIVCMGFAIGFVIGVIIGKNWTGECKKVRKVRQIKFILD